MSSGSGVVAVPVPDAVHTQRDGPGSLVGTGGNHTFPVLFVAGADHTFAHVGRGLVMKLRKRAN